MGMRSRFKYPDGNPNGVSIVTKVAPDQVIGLEEDGYTAKSRFRVCITTDSSI